MATTGVTPWSCMLLELLAQVVAPCVHLVGVLGQQGSGSGSPGDDLVVARVGLEAPDGGDEDRGVGGEPRDAALDVEEPLGPHVGAEPGLGDEEVAVRMPIWSATIEELPVAMLPNGPVWTSAGVFSRVCIRFGLMASRRMHGHRAGRPDVLGGDRVAVYGVADHDPAEPGPQVLQARCTAPGRP